MFDLGAAVPLTFTVTDSSGMAADADTVTLTVTLPDGSTVQPQVTNPPATTGQYAATFVPAQAGRHVARWLAVNPPDAYADVFDVADVMPPSIVSLADAKRQLGIDPDDTSQDDELRAWLAGTTQAVEMAKNEVIARRQVTQTELNRSTHTLRLWKVPVISLDSLAAVDDDRTWDVASDVRVDPETGLVRLISGTSLRGWLTATYTAGYAVVPYNIMQASLVLLQHVWESQRGPGIIGGGVIGPEEAGDYKQMYMLPRKVREWLGPARPAVI